MLKCWIHYSIPVLIVIALKFVFFQIKNIGEDLQTCGYQFGKYEAIAEAELMKANVLQSDQVAYSATISNQCLTKNKQKATLYFWSNNAPLLNSKKIVVGKIYVDQRKHIKMYVKRWFDLEKQSLTVFQKFYDYISNKLACLSDIDFSLIQAVVFARKQYLDNDVKQLFNRLGIGHLLVVSGIHFALIVLLLKNYFLKLICLNINLIQKCRIDQIDFFMSTIVGAAYLYLINFPVSAQRAYVFIVLSKMMHSLGVHYSIYSVLFCSALTLYLFNQQQVETLSFLYSFVCVLAINLFHQKNKLYYSSLKLTLGVFCLSQLLTCWFFSSLNPLAWVLNLILIPLFSVILSGYCLVIVLLLLFNSSQLIEFLAKMLHALNEHFLNLLRYIDGLGVHEVSFESNALVYNMLVSMLCLIVFQIVYKSLNFYKTIKNN